MLSYIALLAERTGGGWGSRLFLDVLWRAGVTDSAPLELDVRPANPALRWYERLGFVTVERRLWWEVPGRAPSDSTDRGRILNLPQASVCDDAFGFSELRIIGDEGVWTVGRLGTRWFRLGDPAAMRDPTLLGTLRYLDPARRLLVVSRSSDARVPGASGYEVAMLRMRANQALLPNGWRPRRGEETIDHAAEGSEQGAGGPDPVPTEARAALERPGSFACAARMRDVGPRRAAPRSSQLTWAGHRTRALACWIQSRSWAAPMTSIEWTRARRRRSLREPPRDGAIHRRLSHPLFWPSEPSTGRLARVADRFGVALIEDEAHAWLSDLVGGACGRLGAAAIFSLHKLLPLPNGGTLVLNGAPIASTPNSPCDTRMADFDLVEIARHRRENLAAWQRHLRPLAGAVDPLWKTWSADEVPQLSP